MTFLAMMIALVLERLSPMEDWLHRDGWFSRWQSRVSALGFSGSIQVLLSVALPCVVAQAILNHLHQFLFGLAWIAAAVVLLLYAMGRGNHSAAQEHYRSQCRRGDFEGALLAASSRYGWFEGEENLDRDRIHEGMQRGFLYEGYQRWFAVLFYFLLLGPVGALAYRLLQMACAEAPAGQRLLDYVDWVPVRLLAAAFTLTGNFVASADELWDSLRSASMVSTDVLYSVALAATGEDTVPAEDGAISGQRAAVQNEIFSALMRRASVCWVALIAVLVILF